MAFVTKNAWAAGRLGTAQEPVLDQWIRVSRATATTPQGTTGTIFNVENGRIVLKALIGEVTTAIQGQAQNLSINVDSDAGAADVLASTLETNADAVGTYYSVEGDGSALLVAEGNGSTCIGNGAVIGAGIITLTASASSTGSIAWDLYYLPLDPTAYVTAA